MDRIVRTLIVLDTDAQSVYLGPGEFTLGPDEVPTTMFFPRSEWVAMGEPQSVSVTIEAVTEPDPPVES